MQTKVRHSSQSHFSFGTDAVYIPPPKRGFDMAQTITGLDFKIREMAFRIRELRQIEGLTTAEMATKTDISEEDYIRCEEGTGDLTFAFIYRCALALGVDVSDIIEGSSPRMRASLHAEGRDSKFRKPTRWCITIWRRLSETASPTRFTLSANMTRKTRTGT